MNTKVEQNMEWNEKEELKGLLAANRRKYMTPSIE